MLRSVIIMYLSVIAYLCMPSAGYADQYASEEGSETNLDIQPTDVIYWDAIGGTFNEKNVLKVDLRLRTEQEFSLYSQQVRFTGAAGYELVEVKAPDTRMIVDPITRKEVAVYYGGNFTLTFHGLEPLKEKVFALSIRYLGCTTRICLFPYTEKLLVPIYFEASTPVSAAGNAPVGDRPVEDLLAEDSLRGTSHLEQSFASKVLQGELSFALLLAVLFLGGLATNLTPCVFPMIPITLRILGGEHFSPVFRSTLYALGIVITYSLIGVAVALTGGMFGAIMANKFVNFFFAALFIVLALTMLGFGQFSLLQSFGAKIGHKRGSRFNAFFMGIGAGFVAAPCTGPILGALIAFTAKNPQSSIPLFFVYSCGFALPYLFLGIAAGRLAGIKVSQHLQNGIKLTFAAIMFALAAYYLRIPAYGFFRLALPHLEWITLVSAVAGGVALLWFLRFAAHSRWMAIAPTLILGITLFSLVQLATGSTNSSAVPLHWYYSDEEAIRVARSEDKPLLIDFWAEWCEACKRMDASTYQSSMVREELNDHWVVVKLDLTEESDLNSSLTRKYAVGGLPLTALLLAGEGVANMIRIEGYIDEKYMIQQLQKFRREKNKD